VLKVFGRQNLNNAQAAAALALAVGLKPESIWQGLSRCHSIWGRNQWVPLECEARVLFDGYNANPESMSALLENVEELSVAGKKILILGEMLELGDESKMAHRELGLRSGQLNPDMVWFLGPSHAAFAAGIEASGFSKKLYISKSYEQNLATEIGSVLDHGDVVVMKGSRGMQLERVLQNWNPVDFKKSE
jgi:UDP-N-acetylmuramoyl-tripeptide--D-alanyl-D-alanine ligase